MRRYGWGARLVPGYSRALRRNSQPPHLAKGAASLLPPFLHMLKQNVTEKQSKAMPSSAVEILASRRRATSYGCAALRTVVSAGLMLAALAISGYSSAQSELTIGRGLLVRIDRPVSSIELRDTGKVVLAGGAEVGYVSASGSSEVMVEHGARADSVILTDGGKVVLGSGAEVGAVSASGDSEIVLENGARADSLHLTGQAVLRSFGGRVSQVRLYDRNEAHIHQIELEQGAPYKSGLSGSWIAYSPSSKLHLYADLISVNSGVFTGKWRNGEEFSIGLYENDDEKGRYQRPSVVPPQVVVHELPGPSFMCSKAATRIERIICGSDRISRMDKQLSTIYTQASATAADPSRLSRAQREWLTKERDKCTTRACLEAAYRKRIAAMLSDAELMTDHRAQRICDAVANGINDGSIVDQFRGLERASEELQNQWKTQNPDVFLSLERVARITHHGRERTVGEIVGGGSCVDFAIEDISAKVPALYPPDDEDQRLRWASWGRRDHFLSVEGEPIVVTGSFRGPPRATLVSWLAPDGAKRALCYLGLKGQTVLRPVRSDDGELCAAVSAGDVSPIPWSETSTTQIPKEQLLRETGIYADDGRIAFVDLDLDGKQDMIAKLDYASGGGCGSAHEWLVQVVADTQSAESPATEIDSAGSPAREFGAAPHEDQPAQPVVTHRIARSRMNEILRKQEWGPISVVDSSFSLSLFIFREKPYILARSETGGAQVVSLWGGEKQEWCEYRLLQQHKVEINYPIATWPPFPGEQSRKEQ